VTTSQHVWRACSLGKPVDLCTGARCNDNAECTITIITQLRITSGIYSSAAVVQVELLWHKFSCRGTSTACPGKPAKARYGAAVP
jgi:hypothetical protein